MRVLFVSRRGIFNAQGGAQVQIRATAAALRRLGDLLPQFTVPDRAQEPS